MKAAEYFFGQGYFCLLHRCSWTKHWPLRQWLREGWGLGSWWSFPGFLPLPSQISRTQHTQTTVVFLTKAITILADI